MTLESLTRVVTVSSSPWQLMLDSSPAVRGKVCEQPADCYGFTSDTTGFPPTFKLVTVILEKYS